MNDGHASAPDAMGELVSLLSDNPETDPADKIETQDADESTDEIDTDEDANAETDEEDDSDDEPEAEEKPAPERKVKVPVKGEDGTETFEEVPETELVKGYQRQADYTKKTQALAERENQAVQYLQAKHQESQAEFLRKAELSRAAIAQLAGIKSESEMDELSRADPAAWVAEQSRQRQVNSFLQALDNQMQGERQQAQTQAQQQHAQGLKHQFEATWQKLSEAKIDRPALEKIYGSTTKTYGFTPEELGNVYDHRLVLMMKDAAAYRELQSKRAEVTKKAEAAPRLPSKQNNPHTTRDKALEQRFKSGRAKLSDLASLLS